MDDPRSLQVKLEILSWKTAVILSNSTVNLGPCREKFSNSKYLNNKGFHVLDATSLHHLGKIFRAPSKIHCILLLARRNAFQSCKTRKARDNIKSWSSKRRRQRPTLHQRLDNERSIKANCGHGRSQRQRRGGRHPAICQHQQSWLHGHFETEVCPRDRMHSLIPSLKLGVSYEICGYWSYVSCEMCLTCKPMSRFPIGLISLPDLWPRVMHDPFT